MTHEAKMIITALSKMRDSARKFRDESAEHSPQASHEWACRVSAYTNALRVVREIANGECTVPVRFKVFPTVDHGTRLERVA